MLFENETYPWHRFQVRSFLQKDPLVPSEILKKVSRSFSLTLMALPQLQREAVTLAYLLARLADTLTDSGFSTTLEKRKSWLLTFLNAVESQHDWVFPDKIDSFRSNALSSDQALTEAEIYLVEAAPRLLQSLRALPSDQAEAVKKVVQILIEGMIFDLEVFPTPGIQSDSEFDFYCYKIAGCVGAFWAEIFELQPQSEMKSLGTDYGKGLQRINILRDCREDLKRNRIYFSKESLEKYNFNFENNLWWEQQEPWREFKRDYIAETRRLLRSGLQFCKKIPKLSIRLRFASLLPLLIGWKTLSLLENNSAATESIKISRVEVKTILRKTIFSLLLFRDPCLEEDFANKISS